MFTNAIFLNMATAPNLRGKKGHSLDPTQGLKEEVQRNEPERDALHPKTNHEAIAAAIPMASAGFSEAGPQAA